MSQAKNSAMAKWFGRDGPVSATVRDVSGRNLAAYGVHPDLVSEHFRIEEQILSGGYGHRQIFELVQNAADALSVAGMTGRIHVLLTKDVLYCANEGDPIDREGAVAILMSHLSEKRGAQIGHFGLGFKSVLAVSRCPQLLSTTGSFAFSEEFAHSEIRRVAPGDGPVPLLRVGRVLDSPDLVTDPTLQELAWATTVVRLPREASGSAWLAGDLKSFPPEFLLFSNHVSSLQLEDRTGRLDRRITSENADGLLRIREADQRTDWRVFEQEIEVGSLTAEAKEDNGPGIQNRRMLPLIWAVPLGRIRGRGRFWAFFPTETETTLAGIVNAPWKTHSDRLNVMDCPFNRDLLDRLVLLVCEAWPQLLDPDDPGAILDRLPARQHDAPNTLDKRISNGLDVRLAGMPSVPGVGGQLAVPATLSLRPDVAMKGRLRAWMERSAEFEASTNLVHRTVEERERRAKAERLGVKELGLKEWLEVISRRGNVAASSAAILLSAELRSELPLGEAEELKAAKVILTTNETLVAASDAKLYLPSRSGEPARPDDGELRPHPALLLIEGVLAELRALGVREVGPVERLKRLLSSSPIPWLKVWELVHAARSPGVEAALVESGRQWRYQGLTTGHTQVLVQNALGAWSSVESILLDGPLARRLMGDDRQFVIDASFHRGDEEVLERLGAIAEPGKSVDLSKDPVIPAFLWECRQSYYESLSGRSSRPHDYCLIFDDETGPGPLSFLAKLGPEGRRTYTEALLPHVTGASGWVMRHSSRGDQYPRKSFDSPALWAIRKYGMFETSLGPKVLADCVGPNLKAWSSVLPVIACDEMVALALNVPANLGWLPEKLWKQALQGVEKAADVSFAARFYVEAAPFRAAPERLLCSVGRTTACLARERVQVTWNREAAEAAVLLDQPVLRVEDAKDAETLERRWGLRRLELEALHVPAGDGTPLLARFPDLADATDRRLEEFVLQPCDSIWYETPGGQGGARRHVDCTLRGRTVFHAAAWEDEELLRAVDRLLGMGLGEERLSRVQARAKRRERRERAEPIRAEPEPALKLLRAIGGDAIRRRLPRESSIQPDGTALIDAEAARFAAGMWGEDLLSKFQRELSEAGFHPPATFCGNQASLEFCDDLGFPDEFAGRSAEIRTAWLEVPGRFRLAPLHDFQEEIVRRVVAFLGEPVPGRGLISLPTGAGKTRVAVEAVIRAAKEIDLHGVVLWISESDELCEQSVLAWRHAWSALGEHGTLRISRLWGATSRDVARAAVRLHVVVATYQALRNRIGEPRFEWLKRARCILIDEAHRAIAPSYTSILKELGLAASHTERPLLGLTATPFRGNENLEESETLAKRFHERRFDHGALGDGDPYEVLQEMGVLARVDHETLEGRDVHLTELQLHQFDQFGVLPRDVEQWLGEQRDRNDRIVERVRRLADDLFPVLLFATSVDNSEVLAGYLNAAGICSASITGQTDRSSRQDYVEKFRDGAVKVLTNYSVLATGFDAPSVRTLIITRPVYSRVLYQQMIGRGLRGPRNGGKERCRIVNVVDNVINHGASLAFHDFEYLWRGGV